jgi:molybdopterin synthase sulfur carrier subunit
MPRIFIPPLLQALTNEVKEIEVSGANVRQAIAELETRYPGVQERLCDGDALKTGLAVAVDGNVSSLGLLQKLRTDSEVHFLPAIGGG